MIYLIVGRANALNAYRERNSFLNKRQLLVDVDPDEYIAFTRELVAAHNLAPLQDFYALTNSDFVIREINIMRLLGSLPEETRKELQEEYGYKERHYIEPGKYEAREVVLSETGELKVIPMSQSNKGQIVWPFIEEIIDAQFNSMMDIHNYLHENNLD